MKFTDELTLLLKARYPIIYINTIEEDRVEYIIRKYIKTSLNRSIYSWDFIDGYTNNPNNEGFAKRNPIGDVVTNDLKKSITRETVDKLFNYVNLTPEISGVSTTSSLITMTFGQ
jgi:hypothetical protein